MTRKLFVTRLAGTQEEMGAQHGRLVADDAARLYEFYRTMPERALAGGLPKVGTRAVRAVANAWQTRLARDRPPELAARTRAFVAAVKERLPHHDANGAFITLATMDSMQNCVSVVARAQLGPFTRPLRARAVVGAIPACSTVVAWGRATEDGELLFGRNFDFPGVGVWDAAPAFVVCAPDHGQRYGFFTTKGADTAVVTVVNEAGIVAAPHTRWHRGVTWGGAMIVDLVHDIARRAETLADAIAIAKERKISSSWGIAVGSAREKTACVVEVAGSVIDVVRAHGDYLTCTNRYRTSTLQAGEISASAAWAIHSDRREGRLRQLVDQRERPLVARDIARFLGDRRDLSAPERERHIGAILAQPLNVHCVVAKPLAREAWVGIDRAPVCEGTWAHVAWDWDGPAGETGFRVETLTDFVAPHDEASRHVGEAMRAYESTHDTAAAKASIDKAIAACPDDPSLRLAAAWLALESKLPDRALVHVHAGLATETCAYRRGQLLLWGARAAQASDPALARRWRDDLQRLDGPGLDELRAHARKKHGGRPRPNLMMVDAY
jgi:Acyl-coenzyme A:6-aminopenicillanic acid acyl-transferase